MLPDFCQGYGSSHIDKHTENQQKIPTGTGGPSENVLNSRFLAEKLRGEEYDEWLNRINDGYLPGGNPNYALNNPIPPPDGENNYYSNSGADGRYKDNKAIYMKDYITTINLGIGILICISIIAKKA
jgi:hypothetical protein